MSAIRKHLRRLRRDPRADRRRRRRRGGDPRQPAADAARLGAGPRRRTSSRSTPSSSTAQAVTPGQGQTVNVAGVEVGEISRVRLEDGKAIVTLKLDEGDVPVYQDASVLLRPKTGLKDMVAELTPGTPEAGELPRGRADPDRPDAARRQPRRDPRRARRRHAHLPAAAARRRRRGAATATASALARHDPPLRAAGARLARASPRSSPAPQANIKRVDPQLLAAGRGARRQGRPARRVRGELERGLRRRSPRQDANLRATLRGAAVDADARRRRALAKTRRLGRRARPDAAGAAPGRPRARPDAAQTRPFLRETTPVIQRRDPPVRARRAARRARELQPALRDLAAVDARPAHARFQIVNALRQHARLQPAGRARGGLPVLGLLAQPPRRRRCSRTAGRARPAPPRPRR